MTDSTLKRTILFLDDEYGLRSLMMKLLIREGYNCLPAADDQQALEILRSKHVDLLIQDLYQEGDVDAGCKFVQLLKSDTQLRHIPIFILSSTNVKKIPSRFSEAGVDFGSIAGYQHKPVDNLKLFAEIKRILGATVQFD